MNDIAAAIHNAVKCTHLIDGLPAIPTQNWVSACASAIAAVSDQAIVISLVATLNADSDRIDVISSGVAIANSPGRQDPRAITLQDKTERISRLGFTIPDNAQSQGLVAPLQQVSPSWNTTLIGRALVNAQSAHPLFHALPIGSGTNGLWLLNFVAFEQGTEQPEPRIALQTLSELHQPLRLRARDALAQVTNPRAWLTDREQGVLDLLILGHSVRVIAEQLGRSAHTVHDHVKNLHKKIGASSRGELIAKALGHKQHDTTISNPVLMQFPGDKIAEPKPGPVLARPLNT